MPRASVRTAIAVKPGFLRSMRAPKRRSCRRDSNQAPARTSRTSSFTCSMPPSSRRAARRASSGERPWRIFSSARDSKKEQTSASRSRSFRWRAKAFRQKLVMRESAGMFAPSLPIQELARSFVAQSDHRIHAHGTTRRDAASGCGYTNKNRGHGQKRERVARGNSKKQAVHEARESGGRNESENCTENSEPGSFAEHEANDIARLRAQSYANTDFMRALRDGIGHDSVNADGCEGEGHASENHHQRQIKFSRGDRGVHQVLHSEHAGRRDAAVEGPDLCFHLTSEFTGISRATHNERHPAFPRLAHLRIQVVNGGLLGLVQAEMFHVAYDTDNRFPASRLVARPFDARAEGVLTGEKLPDEGLVHNDGDGSIFAILSGECASAKERDAHDRKIVAEDGASLHGGFCAELYRTAFDGEIVDQIITAHGEFAGHGGLDGGKRVQGVKQAGAKLALCGNFLVPRFRKLDAHGKNVVRAKSWRNRLHALEATNQQTGTDQQQHGKDRF